MARGPIKDFFNKVLRRNSISYTHPETGTTREYIETPRRRIVKERNIEQGERYKEVFNKRKKTSKERRVTKSGDTKRVSVEKQIGGETVKERFKYKVKGGMKRKETIKELGRKDKKKLKKSIKPQKA